MKRSLTWVMILGLAAPGLAQKASVEKLEGYAEWFKSDALIVDGQRVVAGPATKFRTRGIKSLKAIPLGYQVKAQGVRRADGSVVADSIEVKPSGEEMFDAEIKQATNDLENKWVSAGSLFEQDEKGNQKIIGRLIQSGPQVDRVNRIMSRLVPSYVNRSDLRLHVVETKDWNAMAMGNGAVWVYTGLLNDMNDDEVAIVIGHELVHYTHKHTRRGFVRAMWGQLLATGLGVAAGQAGGKPVAEAVGLAGNFSLLAWQNGYGRDMEDQADRVGLRYAYEGGFDVTRGPLLWQRFLDKYGEQNSVVNFFLGDHSQASARIRNLQREIALNYTRR